MSDTPTSLHLSVSSKRAHGNDVLRITLYARPKGGSYGSLWSRELPLMCSTRDEPTTRLRQLALEILKATGGLDGIADL